MVPDSFQAPEKSGFKGSVGVEFKIISVGGEVSKESEYKHGYEDEVVDHRIENVADWLESIVGEEA